MKPKKTPDLMVAFLIVVLTVTSTSCLHGKDVTTYASKSATSAAPITTGEWTASDQPYKAVEKQIAQDYLAGKNMQTVVEQWQHLVASQPKNPVLQFGFVFAARGAFRAANPDGILPYSLVETLAEHDPGNVHEYTRFRFCMTEEAERYLPLGNIEYIGKMLLLRNPKDELVKINLIYMLCDDNYPQIAMPYAINWVKAEPNNAKAHSSLALVYQDMWFATKNKQYGRMSVQEFKQFLRTAPPSDGFRGLAQNSIKVLQGEIAKAG